MWAHRNLLLSKIHFIALGVVKTITSQNLTMIVREKERRAERSKGISLSDTPTSGLQWRDWLGFSSRIKICGLQETQDFETKGEVYNLGLHSVLYVFS